MFRLKLFIVIAGVLLLPGCAMVPFGIGLIPGAPAYVSSIIGSGQSVYETAMDERTTEQQMLDAIVAGHAQAELYRDKQIRANQITTYCYFGKLYLVGEYDSQEQLKSIYQCMEKVDGKREIISRLYLHDENEDNDFFSDQAKYAELRTQLMADFEVTSTPVEVQIVQGDIILLGVIHDKTERDRIVAHAMSMDGINRVVSYLYHQENAGPEPQIMTAQLAPAPKPSSVPSRDIPPAPKTKSKTQKTRPKVEKKAAQETLPVLAVTNPDRGR
ncbi:transport-associated protein [Pseudodesulfovibrio mercurii]|uniref:Transport-associated protein n=1 Tax=Pseudodesulfovibrio mercurii TaxID=641491 RepID=F0JKE3_9BACT|nr:BON domain-containing protein [Pseudodesulfovibrio mercurii]EGB16392.1 transport-associated protein [Pseudodesulfovibrio mercurii]